MHFAVAFIVHNYVNERSEVSCHLLCLLRIYAIQPRFPILHIRNRSLFYHQNGYSDLVAMSSELYDKFARMNRIDEPRKIVYVVTIQYQGRNL